MGKLLDQAGEQEEQDRLQVRLDREKEAAERKADIAELKRLLSYEQRRQAYMKIIADHAPLLSVPTVKNVKFPRKAPRHTWTALLSDWHCGQRSHFKETGYLFEQTSEIAKRQIELLWNRIAHLHEIACAGTKAEELVLLVIGDIVEGDGMRPSQATKIDAVVAQQVVQAADLLSWFITQCLTRFEHLIVRFVGGNHDRLSQKAGDAGLGELAYIDTHAWVCGEYLRRLFADAISKRRIDFENSESFFGGLVAAKQRIVFEHGASFKSSSGSYGGIGFYGIANAARGYMEMLNGADILCMGHFHTPMVLPMGNGWQILNGSLPPSTGWVQSSFKKYRRPAQTLFKLHEEHGLIGWEPIYLDLPDVHRGPGEFWARFQQ